MKAVGKNNMQTKDLEQAGQVWPSVARVLFVPHTEEEYEELVSVLDALIDIVGEDEQHPLASLMEVIGVLIEKYEDEHVPEITDL
jgi:HTH-type transcriptional regulator / antitoxin HigA